MDPRWSSLGPLWRGLPRGGSRRENPCKGSNTLARWCFLLFLGLIVTPQLGHAQAVAPRASVLFQSEAVTLTHH